MAQPGRAFHTQQIHYLRKSITYEDGGTTVEIGTLPAGAQILKPLSGVAVNIAFNGGTTNTCSIGPTSDSGTDLYATALALGTIGFVPFDEAVSLLVGSSDVPVSAAVVSAASPSAGQAEIIIAYVPDNDR